MVDNKKDDGSSDEFDDINFDDFSDDFDEAQLEEEEALADLPEEDFSDENFGDDDWEDDGDDETDSGADPNLITQGKGKGGGLSFNTVVMIGAFILGAGVLAVNVMVKSGAQSSSGTSMFQSMLNIGNVMDGDFFGDKKDEAASEDVAASTDQARDEGFLNNPQSLDPNANPPQPTPIAPPEEAAGDNQPLTPMPGDDAATVHPGETPRGPDDGAPESQVAIAELPADAQTPPASVVEETPVQTPSAEDILKKAMENREQKTAAADPVSAADPTPAAEPAPAPEEAAKPVVADIAAPEPTAPVPAITDVPATVPAETAAKTPDAVQPAVSSEALAENARALEAVDNRLEELSKRMEQIEGEIGTVKDSKQAGTQELEQTIATLKDEIAALKNRPAAPEAPASTKKAAAAPEPAQTDDAGLEEEAPKPVVKKASKPKAAKKSASPTAVSGRWELRAAQPGRAWVSKPGERDMQSVEVGQTLAGIGRVTAILYQNGRWTVQGTSGQIQQ